MKKFTMAVATASLLSATAFADSCASSFSGFYAGAQAGANSATIQVKDKAADTKGSLGGKGFVGGLFAGYGMGVGSCAYVGAELYLNLGNTNISQVDDTGVKSTLTIGYNYGAKARLGYTVSPQSMLFLGLGLERAKMSAKVDGESAGKKQKISFAPSVGMDMFVNKNIFLRGEFTHVFGPKINEKDSDVTSKATQQRFTLGLGYKF